MRLGLVVSIILGLLLGCVSGTRNRATPSRTLASEPNPDLEPPRRGATPNAMFDWPVDEARLTRGYFLKPPRGKSKRPHLGIDLAAPRGTSIFAAHDGVVIYSGRDFRGFGRMVMLEGHDGWATLYAHLSKSRVREGERVAQGDQIGDMGRTGRATGVHLHFEIRTRQGPVNPLEYLPQAPRFAGLPMKPLEEGQPF